ncbi:MAG: hypothetical protein K0Q55_3167 [Verrucomicrobia bacterium]|jgi:uncharacterized membrane protein YjfL (UPF0719 family)|nr:hypothetical protein [Verrucomicrobiota bacterium]
MDIDDDEMLLLIVGFIGAVVSIGFQFKWWTDIPLGRTLKARLPFLMVKPLCVTLMIIPALLLWSDPEVKASGVYLTLLTTNGLLWLFLWKKATTLAGVSFDVDVQENNNGAAGLALAGGLIGVSFIYCGSNVGTGPSLWNNVFSVIVGTIGFFLWWMIFEANAHISRAVTEDRDPAAGLRLAGMLVALGLICGRAVAGNWESPEATLRDFIVDSWFCAALLLVAIPWERRLRPTPSAYARDVLQCGFVPAFVYIVMAAGWVWHLGWWEGAR